MKKKIAIAIANTKKLNLLNLKIFIYSLLLFFFFGSTKLRPFNKKLLQTLMRNWLNQIINHTCLQAILQLILRAKCRACYYWNIRQFLFLNQLFDFHSRLNSIHNRHLIIH